MNQGTKLIRYALIAINFIFAICGIGMITVGALGTRQDMTHFLGSKYISAPIICILVGCIIFVVAFFGCFGALKYNHVMVLVFALLVFVVIVLEIAGGICAYTYREKTEAFLKKSMEESLSRNHNDTIEIWDALQSHLECCGTNGPADYRKHNFTVPRSCCKNSATCVEADAWRDGCYLKVSEVFSRHIIAIFAVAIGFAIVELLIFMSSLLLAHEIKKENEALN